MGGLPPAALILIVAALSALAGALLTWLIMYVTGKGQGDTGQKVSREKEAPRDDLLRVIQTGTGPAVFVRGNRVHRLEEIEDPQTGEEAIAGIKTVLAFAERWLPAVQGEKDEPVPPTPSHDRRPVDAAAPPPTPLRNRIVAERASNPSSVEPLRLVEEINLLMQRRLKERPDLARRGIRLTHDIQGRILIYVGQQRYRSADQIPDEDVSAFIRDTIQIWESE